MAYQAKRKKLYMEDFLLTEEDGTVVHTLHVALDPDSMARKLSEKHVALVNALQGLNGIDAAAAPEEALETVGKAITDILEAVFGPEDASVILEFYDNRYMEMCVEVMPFVTDRVIPEVRRLAQENKQAIVAGYNRKQRRMAIFGRK